MNIKIIVASHKKYKMPDNDLYLPIQVGAYGKESIGFQRDDEGENISYKNSNYCELTGLYWAWKNLNADYIGLCHYRRYFTIAKLIPNNKDDKFKYLLTEKQIEEKLQGVDMILPCKRRYFIENLYSHYKHTMYIEPLDITEKIIEEKYPTYLKEFNKLKKRTSAHIFNMFIMKKEYLNQYCNWLFDILFELEKRVDSNQYDSFHARYLGRISELLLDVWINTNKLKYEEVKVLNIEPINWFRKGSSFLKAKFMGEKYEKSF